VVQQPNSGLGHLTAAAAQSNTIRNTYTPSNTPLNEWSHCHIRHHLHSRRQTNKHPCPQRVSNSRTQQSIRLRLTPLTSVAPKSGD